MENLFVPYKIALLLKKKGFDEECLGVYYGINHSLFTDVRIKCFKSQKTADDILGDGKITVILSPIHQQVLDWLLEKHNLDIHAHKMWHYSYNYEEKRMETFYQVAVSDFTIDREARDAHGDRIYQKYISSTLLKTYKEAIEDGITWALKHIK